MNTKSTIWPWNVTTSPGEAGVNSYNKNWSIFHWCVFVWFFPSVCLIGGIMNLLCFWVILRHGRLFPRVTRQFMLIISLNDALILLLKAPTHYLVYMSRSFVVNHWRWYSNPFHKNLTACLIYTFISYYALFGAPFFQLGLTVDRLVAVASPLRAKQIMTTSKSYLLLAGVTALALALPILRTAIVQWDAEANICNADGGPHLSVSVGFVELFYGRVLLMLCLIAGTLVICWLIHRSNAKNAAGSIENLSAKNLAARKRFRVLTRLSILLALFNVVFLTCNLPWSLTVVLQFSGRLDHLTKNTRELIIRQLNTIMYFQCVLNVLVYFAGQSFRQKFAHSIRRCCRCCRCCGIGNKRGSVSDGGVFSLTIPSRNAGRSTETCSTFKNALDSLRY